MASRVFFFFFSNYMNQNNIPLLILFSTDLSICYFRRYSADKMFDIRFTLKLFAREKINMLIWYFVLLRLLQDVDSKYSITIYSTILLLLCIYHCQPHYCLYGHYLYFHYFLLSNILITDFFPIFLWISMIIVFLLFFLAF